MDEIYKKCDDVVIWLGDSKLGRLRRTCRSSHYKWDEALGGASTVPGDTFGAMFTRYSRPRSGVPLSLQHLGFTLDPAHGAHYLMIQLADDKHISTTKGEIPLLSLSGAFHLVAKALDGITSHPWWTRQRVIQETVLPVHALLPCGHFTIRWCKVAQAARNYEQAPHELLCRPLRPSAIQRHPLPRELLCTGLGTGQSQAAVAQRPQSEPRNPPPPASTAIPYTGCDQPRG